MKLAHGSKSRLKLRPIILSILFAVSMALNDRAFALGSNDTAPFVPTDDAQASAEAKFNVLDYIQRNIDDESTPNDPNPKIPKYDRRQHFGGWVRQDANRPCANTREMVLVRDADQSVPITYRQGENCIVDAGLWNDPYTGLEVRKAADIQIDHMVALRNAYYSGGYAWRPAIRCHYSNFIGNSFHLISVLGHENMSKGDGTPARYLPPNKKYRCQYVSDWMKIKAIWELKATTEEVEAIEAVLRNERCHESYREMPKAQLVRQRTLAATPIEPCERYEKDMLLLRAQAEGKGQN